MSARVKPGKTFEKLSVRQKNILRFVHGYIETHGYSPTMREIGQGANTSSTFVVRRNLDQLVEWGYIRRAPRAARSLQVLIRPPQVLITGKSDQ